MGQTLISGIQSWRKGFMLVRRSHSAMGALLPSQLPESTQHYRREAWCLAFRRLI